MSINLEENSWNMPVQRIMEGKCILILGPNIGMDEPGQTMNLKLREYLIENHDPEIKHYSDDEFFSFSDTDSKESATYAMQQFFQSLKPSDIYDKIAEIPFHLIISVSPDHVLRDIIKSKKVAFNFEYYNRERNPSPLEKPTTELPLLYNLFGDIDNAGSLIFTYDDLFDYLAKIFGEFKLPQTLQTELKNASVVLFLGFDFHKWYFKLLLRLLKLKEINAKRAADKDNLLHAHTKAFYKGEFDLKFVDKSSDNEIVDIIYKKCLEKGILRTKNTQPAAMLTPLAATDIYISYKWGGASEQMANAVEERLLALGANFIRDKTCLPYNESIKEFMKKIGKGKYVIVIISHEYLRSENCMFEMLELRKNDNVYEQRVFPIVLNDAMIFRASDRLEYRNYWDTELKKLNEMFKAREDVSGLEDSNRSVTLADQITKAIDNVLAKFGSTNTLTPDMHISTGFDSLIKAIQAQRVSESEK